MQNRVSKTQLLKIKNLMRRNKVRLAYLFGSVLTPYFNKDSDVDVAILLSSNLPKSERFNLRLKLISDISRIFKREVDVVALNDNPSLLFRYQVIRDGQLIYQKNEEDKIGFEMSAMTNYFDFQPFLLDYNRAYVKTNLQ